MRALTIAVVLAFSLAAVAQEPPQPLPPSSPSSVEPLPPPPYAGQAPVASPSAASLAGPSLTVSRARPSPYTVGRWRTARTLTVIGSVFNLIGTGLSLTSAIYIAATDYPPSTNQLLAPPARPSDPGPALAYAGASVSAAGFVLSAAGLGWEHRLLDQLGADPGRGAFGVGTAFGVVGFASVGLSYFFGLTDYLNPHDQSVALLTTSLAGTALCAIAGILYSVDSSHLNDAWRGVLTF